LICETPFLLHLNEEARLADNPDSRVNEDSILAVQVFDQKKFKKKDQGFLGVINIRIGDIIELAPDADGMHGALLANGVSFLGSLAPELRH